MVEGSITQPKLSSEKHYNFLLEFGDTFVEFCENQNTLSVRWLYKSSKRVVNRTSLWKIKKSGFLSQFHLQAGG